MEKSVKFCPTRYLVKDPDTSHLSSRHKLEVSWCLAMVCVLLVGRTYSEAFSYLLPFLQTFNVELAPNHPEPKMEFDIVMVPDCGVSLQLTKRAVARRVERHLNSYM
jgi:hypothetical protein